MRATELVPLSVPEVRRLVLARQQPPERQHYLLAWSYFRRTHQAHASQAHTARRADRHARTPVLTDRAAAPSPPALRLASTATLTEPTWAQIALLLPKLQVAPKRTRYDHRRVLDGILAVMRSGRSWRAAPAGDVPWTILFQRYSLWRRRGIWDAILAILHSEADTLFVT